MRKLATMAFLAALALCLAIGEAPAPAPDAAGVGTVSFLDLPNLFAGPKTGDTLDFDPESLCCDLVNRRIGVGGAKWETAFFINFLTDETAFPALDRQRGTLARVGYLTNQPRTFGLSARVIS